MNKYPKRKTTRLKEYDYSQSGYYYVTICAKDHQNIFANIYNNHPVGALLACAHYNNSVKIQLTKIGQIIDHQWNNIPNQFKNVKIDIFIIMPNHIHGILIINKRDNVSLRAQASSAPTLSQIIRSFKSKCTNEYLDFIIQNKLNKSGKIWQKSFHDHIIRNDKSLNKIREYIINNPATWDQDENDSGHNKPLEANENLSGFITAS